MSGRAPVLEVRSGFLGWMTAINTPVLSHVAAWLVLVVETRRQRRALLALDEHMLKDIGLTAGDAYREAHRGMLDIPPHKIR